VMDWFEIFTSVVKNIFWGCLVILSYKLSYEFAQKHVGWSGYKRILWVIGLIGIYLIFIEYSNLGHLSDIWLKFVTSATLTILISALTGVLIANRNAKKNEQNFYGEIRSEQIDRYQDCFNKVLQLVDVDNNTNWAHGKKYDKDKLAKDDAVMNNVISHEATSKGLNPVYLQILVNQYFFADTWEREKDVVCWVDRILNRKSTDYFPDPWTVYKMIDGMNK
jgi:hypothetical protein